MGQANGLEIPESVTETNADAAKEALSKAEAAVEAAKEAKANAMNVKLLPHKLHVHRVCFASNC
ncbi:hypothetical protein, partial [Enterococcus faecalis]|uniref:hypothetical protein n=1 Tax=Enterococcus faecalis TaxID=1351 RepID=UPI00100372A6